MTPSIQKKKISNFLFSIVKLYVPKAWVHRGAAQFYLHNSGSSEL